MKELTDVMYVSRQTLSSDMRQVEKILEKHQLKLIRRPNYGICIEGCEKTSGAALQIIQQSAAT